MRLVLLGPPGAGKGTQASALAARFGVPHVSTGDILRENVSGGTELGREAQAFMDRGDLVPDDLVNRMVADRLAHADAAAGFLLDGYPRTVPQALVLEELLAGREEPLDGVLRFVVDLSELLQRLSARREIEGRADDSEEAVRRRFEEYRAKTRPLEDFYAERGLLREVDAVGAVQEVTERAIAAVDGHNGADMQGRATGRGRSDVT